MKYTVDNEIFVFKDRNDAQTWIDNKIKEYGNKQILTSSSEYRNAYPAIQKAWNVELIRDAPKAMSDAGVKFGDRVRYDIVGSFGNVKKQDGVIINIDGIPYVKIDGGRRKVMWHKGFRK